MGNGVERYIYSPGSATLYRKGSTCCREGDGAQNACSHGVNDALGKITIFTVFHHNLPTPTFRIGDSMNRWPDSRKSYDMTPERSLGGAENAGI
jgi:hypothetical protein